MIGVEARQGFVEQQHGGRAEQGLRDQDALALSARQRGQRPPRQVARLHKLEHAFDVAPLTCPVERPAIARSGNGAQQQVVAGEVHLGQRLADLRHVADLRIAAPRGHAIDVGASNPDKCTPDHDCGAHPQGHRHRPGCGHEAVPHGDHVDYLVAGHLHHPHGAHCDNHGPLEVVAAHGR
jgi:hypothetical protein